MGPVSEIDYPRLMREALLEVPRRALLRAAREGLPGDHHFYVSFRTDHPGVSLAPGLKARHPREMTIVVLPDYLRAKYPEEMTIVLQHQYWDLAVGDEAFSVTLRFGGAAERLHVPFAALTAFVDPAAEFGLRFDGPGEARAVRPADEAASSPEGGPPLDGAGQEDERRPRNVVDIRSFRRGDETEPAG
jgi:hypothetical protein